MADAELLWRWANDPETRRSAFSKAPIAYDDHVAWLRRKLASDATRIWIFADDGAPVGQVRFDMAGDVAEIDISVAPEGRGRGYGLAMLVRAIENFREECGAHLRPRALVLAHNVPSLRMFRACGFEEVGVERRVGAEDAIVLELAEHPAGEEGG